VSGATSRVADDAVVSPDGEEVVRKRLSGLGYIQ
jgi:hypothetical protein